jgi:hypothetical protein
MSNFVQQVNDFNDLLADAADALADLQQGIAADDQQAKQQADDQQQEAS